MKLLNKTLLMALCLFTLQVQAHGFPSVCWFGGGDFTESPYSCQIYLRSETVDSEEVVPDAVFDFTEILKRTYPQWSSDGFPTYTTLKDSKITVFPTLSCAEQGKPVDPNFIDITVYLDNEAGFSTLLSAHELSFASGREARFSFEVDGHHASISCTRKSAN